jgi:glutamate dehydrogenase/leucine dehydrogenase
MPALLAYKEKTGKVKGFPGSEDISNEDLLALRCDILVPAALENAITGLNATKVNTRVVAEAANGPTTPEADAILFENGIMVLPDILANAGGVTVSYFEWVQDNYSFFWKEKDVNDNLREVMVKSFQEVLQTAQRRKLDMRRAAYVVAVDRVAEAIRVRGIYP